MPGRPQRYQLISDPPDHAGRGRARRQLALAGRADEDAIARYLHATSPAMYQPGIMSQDGEELFYVLERARSSEAAKA